MEVMKCEEGPKVPPTGEEKAWGMEKKYLGIVCPDAASTARLGMGLPFSSTVIRPMTVELTIIAGFVTRLAISSLKKSLAQARALHPAC